MKKDKYIFRCHECKFQEEIVIESNPDMDIQSYLDENTTTSTGVHVGCGTRYYGVYEDGRYLLII